MEKTIASQPIQKEIKINNQFLLFPNSRLGSGAFGQIFKGVNIKTKEDVEKYLLEPVKNVIK